MYNIDLKDRKILFELDTNSRQSFNEIAKKVGLSKDSIIYRINKLKDEGIIQKFHTVIDVGRLGFTSFRLYLKLQNTTPENETQIIEFLKSKKIVTWIVSIDGEYDLGMWVLARSIKEMNTLWKELFSKFGDFIEKKELTVFTKVTYFPRTYFLDKQKNRQGYVFITEPQETNLDDTEMELLKLLASDSRISILELSHRLDMTPKTITSKIKRLEKNKIIIGYRTMFDLEKLGYQYFKIHFNLHNSTEQKEKQFRTYLQQNPNVIYDNEVLGGDDLEIELQVPSIQDLRNFLDSVKKQYAEIIRNYKYMLFYKEHKYVFLPV